MPDVLRSSPLNFQAPLLASFTKCLATEIESCDVGSVLNSTNIFDNGLSTQVIRTHNWFESNFQNSWRRGCEVKVCDLH